MREARAAAALNHASICTIHDVGEAEGQAYIAMELVEGKPLSKIVHARGLTFVEVLNYGSQIAEALVHAHARGVIHRDLKSANATYRAGMKRAGEAMAVRARQRHVPAIGIARMFAHAGEKDSSLEWLEKAYENRESPMERLGVFWDWHTLRAEPRFQDLLRRLNLPH